VEATFVVPTLSISNDSAALLNCALIDSGRVYMSFGNSLLVALFLMLVVFVALFALYLFVTLFSLIVQTMEFSAKRKKAAQH